MKAVDLYVSVSGNDTDSGTKNKPLATLQVALERVRELRKTPCSEPIEIIMKEGTYQIDQPVVFTSEDSGSEESPLVIKSRGKVVFMGGKALPPFVKVSDRLWKIELNVAVYNDGPLQQLYVNGARAVRARTPNTGFFPTRMGVVETIDSSRAVPFATQQIKLTKEQFDVLPQSGSEKVLISVNHAWDCTRKYIRGVSQCDTTITIDGKPMQRWNNLDRNSQFILENSRSFLDVPGEWFMDDSNTLYYIPRETEQIENAIAVAPVAKNFLQITGTADNPVKNIAFEGISFQYTRYTLPNSGEEPEQGAASTDASIMLDFAKNIRFDNCEIAHTGNNGIWFRRSCAECSITRSYLHDLGIGGVKIGTKDIPSSEKLYTRNILVDNNIIRAGGKEIPTGIGLIIFQSGDNTVSHNEITDFKYTGVSVGWIWGYAASPAKRNKIIYNHIHHIGQGELSDMGGIYTLGKSEGTVLGNNVIHDIDSYGYGGWGLYTDEGSTGILLENNLVYNCKSSGFHQHYGENNIVRNNIFALNRLSQLEASKVEEHTSFSFTNNIVFCNDEKLFDKPGVAGWTNWELVKSDEDYNCFWSTKTERVLFGDKHLDEWRRATGKDVHSVVEDPGFVDPEGYDFNFKNESVPKKIGFVPVDYSEAGVYGSKAWKKLAQSGGIPARE